MMWDIDDKVSINRTPCGNPAEIEFDANGAVTRGTTKNRSFPLKS